MSEVNSWYLFFSAPHKTTVLTVAVKQHKLQNWKYPDVHFHQPSLKTTLNSSFCRVHHPVVMHLKDSKSFGIGAVTSLHSTKQKDNKW